MQDLSLDEKPYIKKYGIIESSEGCLPCSMLFPMHQITKIHGDNVFSPEVRHAVQKRRDYGETFNLAQKAVRSTVETGGESLCHLKKSLNE
ncbi:hypothetical protein F8M41_018965 [Gigaspora margarita]|uniref:Uncharacterized protein n=1 Tax=Gigaspora margarita TaxID=4874 RepID=A0A8H3WUX0_GIGMA|nr:hypothetical protein F8M41_018965 [Gigaspora margarita]